VSLSFVLENYAWVLVGVGFLLVVPSQELSLQCVAAADLCTSASLRYGHEFEHMAFRVPKIDAPTAVPIIELTVVEAPRCAAVRKLRLANAAEDGIKLGIADVESVVVALELVLVVEKERESVVDTYWRKMAGFRIGIEAKNARKKLRRCPLIMGRDDGVVEGDGHRKISRYGLPKTSRSDRP
jgi:hypothetical protein